MELEYFRITGNRREAWDKELSHAGDAYTLEVTTLDGLPVCLAIGHTDASGFMGDALLRAIEGAEGQEIRVVTCHPACHSRVYGEYTRHGRRIGADCQIGKVRYTVVGNWDSPTHIYFIGQWLIVAPQKLLE